MIFKLLVALESLLPCAFRQSELLPLPMCPEVHSYCCLACHSGSFSVYSKLRKQESFLFREVALYHFCIISTPWEHVNSCMIVVPRPLPLSRSIATGPTQDQLRVSQHHPHHPRLQASLRRLQRLLLLLQQACLPHGENVCKWSTGGASGAHTATAS